MERGTGDVDTNWNEETVETAGKIEGRRRRERKKGEGWTGVRERSPWRARRQRINESLEILATGEG
eukprot:4538970-Pleurochrysis_carterae.AAC.1